MNKVPLIGNASHRFNLAVKDMISEHYEMIMALQKLMKKPRTTIRMENLCKYKKRAPVTSNITPWYSTYPMVSHV